MKDKKKYRKVRDHCHYTGEDGSNYGSNYDCHFIIKKLAKEFKKQFTCLGENTEEYITFTVPMEKQVTRIDKNGEEITRNISYVL